MEVKAKVNPLGVVPVKNLMVKFAIPSIIAMLVSSLYNIVDQLFIGQAVGTLGIAATNVVFPLTTISIALALLFGIGGASNFNLDMGRGERDRAINYIGNAAVLLFFCGVVLLIVTQIFMRPLLVGFGTPDDVMPYAIEYTRITAIGFPFLIFTAGGCHLVRADGSPKMSMWCNIIGAVINVALDAIFVIGLDWGMAGAAWATIIGQIVSALVVFRYMLHFKTVPLKKEHLKLHMRYVKPIVSIGMASCVNQLAMMVTQIVLNNSLTFYGALSIYGEATPLAIAGIGMKTFQLFFGVVIGLVQGGQPIFSFNYGAEKYDRVRSAYKMALTVGMIICIVAFIMFQTIPEQLIGLFGDGDGDALYFEFGVLFFRTFLFGIFLAPVQTISSTFFTAIGKPKKGMFLSLTRQIIFLIPLILILSKVFGLMGILYAAPIADAASFIAALTMLILEFKDMKRLEIAAKARVAAQ
ncbi:MAG: MATE family efflux transporter [Eubacterium sp.]|nr:MATE family efflux transporter [Eubacterium sp.]